MRHTHAHTANRRSHHGLKGARFAVCTSCKTEHVMHRACPNCGKYRDRVVLAAPNKAIKKAKKEKDREVSEGKKS